MMHLMSFISIAQRWVGLVRLRDAWQTDGFTLPALSEGIVLRYALSLRDMAGRGMKNAMMPNALLSEFFIGSQSSFHIRPLPSRNEHGTKSAYFPLRGTGSRSSTTAETRARRALERTHRILFLGIKKTSGLLTPLSLSAPSRSYTKARALPMPFWEWHSSKNSARKRTLSSSSSEKKVRSVHSLSTSSVSTPW